jgi:hypothetical protein
VNARGVNVERGQDGADEGGDEKDCPEHLFCLRSARPLNDLALDGISP